MNWVIEYIDFNSCIILFRKLKSDKASHQKVIQPNQTAAEKHRKDISTSKSVSASSTLAQPSISTAKTQATSSTSSQPSSYSSQPSTIDLDQRNSSDHLHTSLEETSQTLREVAQSAGEVTPPASNSETSMEQQGREIEQKKRRKDKSAMRKSQINAGQEDSEGKILICRVWPRLHQLSSSQNPVLSLSFDLKFMHFLLIDKGYELSDMKTLMTLGTCSFYNHHSFIMKFRYALPTLP